MIWTTQHISEEGKQAELFMLDCIRHQTLPRDAEEKCFRVGIVGGGPKGMYAVDHLLTKLRETSLHVPVEIYWLNTDTSFGCGPNYHIQQPDYLLINYCIGHVDAWMRSVSAETEKKRNLLDWIRYFCPGGGQARPTDFASRALVGRYLQWVAMEVIRTVPEQVRLFLMPEEVKSIEQQPDGRFLLHTETGYRPMDNILLATGHCYENTPLISSEKLPLSRYIRRAYPVHHLDRIPPNNNVGVAGLGLTFIDVALHLTEGRGGVFDEAGNYVKSGREPAIFPFSRNHLPILPRGAVYGRDTYQLYYLNDDWIQQIEDIHRERKIDFSKDIYPMLDKEIQFAYYSTLLQLRDASKVEQYITTLGESEKFGMDALLFPKIEKKGSLQQTYIAYLEYTIGEAEKGELRSPLMAAAAVWREATPIIGKWYKACGFTGDSQKKLDKELFGAFCRTSFGPPIGNMKKILSLLKSDIIQMVFENPVEMLSDENRQHYMLKSGDTALTVDFIVDARIARPDLHRNNSDLYTALSQNGLVKPLQNEQYRPGCPFMDVYGSSVVNGQRLNLYFYGSNTEGFLLDNDSLSRTKNNLAAQWALCTLQQLLDVSVQHKHTGQL